MSSSAEFFRACVLTTVLAVGAIMRSTEALAQGSVAVGVSDSVSGLAISGTVILLLDPSGRVVRRAITDERGRASLPASTTSARLLARRLGYRQKEIALSPDDTAGRSVAVRLTRLPSILEPVAARASAICPRRRDSEGAFALWQQAKIALEASAIAREQQPPVASFISYRREIAAQPESAAILELRVRTGETPRPFVAARAPSAFVDSGFRRGNRSGTFTYFGPDADVLLSEEFQNHYCFELVAPEPPRSPQLIGIQFRRPRTRPGRVDLVGRAWVDTASLALTSIEFDYTGLEPGASHHRPGGSVSFADMPNGSTLVHRWTLRMVTPIVERARPLRRGGSPGEWGETGPPRFEVVEGGGAIAGARWPDGRTWAAPLGSWRVRLTDVKGQPARGVVVSLDSTDYVAISDSSGVAHLRGLLPGTYRVTLFDTLLYRVGIRVGMRMSLSVAGDSVIRSVLAVPTRYEYVARVCGTEAPEPTGAVLLGRALRRDGSPAAGASWEIDDARGETDANGMFLRCWRTGAPASVRVSVSRDRGKAPFVVTEARLVGITALPMVVEPR